MSKCKTLSGREPDRVQVQLINQPSNVSIRTITQELNGEGNSEMRESKTLLQRTTAKYHYLIEVFT
jgi:hypothetical protein